MKATRTYTMAARAEGVVATRERIARAAMELFLAQPFDDVTLAAIAAAAGVSHQTVLNHFQSKEGVALGVVEILRMETAAARNQARPSDIPGAVKALVGEYERIGDANVRWAASDRLGSLAVVLDEARASHQAWIASVFNDRLPTTPAARRRAIHALHAATDAYTWKLLRRDLHLSRAETEKIIVDLVVGVLGLQARSQEG
jgi:AcrR family transcriptional regulator